MRAACACALVLSLTAVAGWLGPQLSGLLAPFPIIATVLATFTHAQRGTDELLRLLRGLVSGFGAFALFCFTLAVSLRTLDTAAAFALATRGGAADAGAGARAGARRARLEPPARAEPRARAKPPARANPAARVNPAAGVLRGHAAADRLMAHALAHVGVAQHLVGDQRDEHGCEGAERRERG